MRTIIAAFIAVISACGGDRVATNVSGDERPDAGVILDSVDGRPEINFSCGDGFIEIDGACCPETLPQQCGSTCAPAGCQCVQEYGICVPPDWQYCGAGIACPPDEDCIADGETFECVPSDRTYCGDGVSCDTSAEECVSDESGAYCMPSGWEFCGSGRSCSPREHCAGEIVGCCPDEQIACGNEHCCFEHEECAEGGVACIPRDGHWCNGEICPAGFDCALDGLPLCVPITADYCGDGRMCPTGVCASDGGCCPLGLPQRCGSVCCSEEYDCRASAWGNVCLPPGVTACGPGSQCDPDEFCAREGLCLPVGAELCPDGHWCPSGLNCSGPTCCREYAPTFCGDLCCPSGWQCIGGGVDCIPPGAEFCSTTGIWCGPDSHCSDASGQCITIGWQECGSGPPCAPDQVCAEEGANQQCCPAGQPILCGSICCDVEFQCVHASGRDICIPAGATYCDGRSEQEWCPVGTRCGRRLCVPVWLDECADGSYCPGGYECTELNPPCCPIGTSACDNRCCPVGTTCTTFNGEPYCLSIGAEICRTSFGDTICPVGTFCESDGFCLNDRYLRQAYEYCGGGRLCSQNEHCTGLCADFCCGQDIEQIMGCLRQCGPENHLCHDVPTSNSRTSYLNPIESYITPDDVPHELGDWGSMIEFETLGGLFGPSASVNFHPAGFTENYHNGVYTIAEGDANWIQDSGEILTVAAAWIIDNLEGIDFPHGPYAQLYLLTYDDFPDIEQVSVSRAINPLNGYYGHYLKGPLTGSCSWEVCVCYFEFLGICTEESCYCGWYDRDTNVDWDTNVEQEWTNGIFMRYAPSDLAGIHRWGQDQTAIRLALKESDSGLPEYREDDFMGFERIDREASKRPCGVWVPLYKYTDNGDNTPEYYQRTGSIGAFLLLRTISRP